jgi:hypothetical protein
MRVGTLQCIARRATKYVLVEEVGQFAWEEERGEGVLAVSSRGCGARAEVRICIARYWSSGIAE